LYHHIRRPHYVVDSAASRAIITKNKNFRITPPQFARAAGVHRNYVREAIKKAVVDGEDVNEVEGAGNTPVHAAAYDGWIEGIELLVSLGAKLNASNNAGDRAYHIASYMNHSLMMEWLEKVRLVLRYLSHHHQSMNILSLPYRSHVPTEMKQNGGSKDHGEVLVQDHVPKVQVQTPIFVLISVLREARFSRPQINMYRVVHMPPLIHALRRSGCVMMMRRTSFRKNAGSIIPGLIRILSTPSGQRTKRPRSISGTIPICIPSEADSMSHPRYSASTC
jgi:hypothetical protein